MSKQISLAGNEANPAIAAEPSALLIAKGILKGYLPHPNLFILSLLATMIKIKKQLHRNIPGDIKKTMALTIAIYRLLQNRMEKNQALSLVKVILVSIGLVKQYGLFRYVEEPDHSFNNLIKYSKMAKNEGPMRLNKMKVTVEDENAYEFVVSNCIFKKIFEQFDCPELLGIFCSIDNALYGTYSPNDIAFSRGGINKTIAAGHESCHFICVNMNANG